MLLFSRLSWIHILWAKHFRKTKLNCRTRIANSIILSLTSICYNFFALLHNRYIVKEKMRHSIRCFSIRYDVSINKSKYLERKIWLEVELLFSFRLMFSERSLVRFDSHEWTLNLPQNMIFQINSETTLARRWCNTWERWLLWTAYCLLLFEPLVKKATLVFVDQLKKID